MNDELKRLHAENATKALKESMIVKHQIRQRLERVLKRLQESGEIAAHVTVDDWLRDDTGAGDGAH
jgi:predicted nucleotide-binding protein (sugar kinase/HSP70/actin superfamily)